MSNHYHTLEVSREASAEEIQRAYRVLAFKYHPDRNEEPGAAARMTAINEAYEVLGDAAKRRQYDQSTAKPARPSPSNEISGSILLAAKDVIVRSGWRVLEDNGRNLLLESARTRVRIVLTDRLDQAAILKLDRQFKEFLGVLTVCIEGPLPAMTNSVVIDLVRSERHGAAIPEGLCRTLLSPFL
jgi:curved DNA-binding protein CbpA